MRVTEASVHRLHASFSAKFAPQRPSKRLSGPLKPHVAPYDSYSILRPSCARSCPATSGTWVYKDDQAELLDVRCAIGRSIASAGSFQIRVGGLNNQLPIDQRAGIQPAKKNRMLKQQEPHRMVRALVFSAHFVTVKGCAINHLVTKGIQVWHRSGSVSRKSKAR